MPNSLWILLVSTASIAFLHALAPDHWMPFVVISKAQKWSKVRLFWMTLISGVGHVGISILFSAVGILLGFSLSKLEGVEGQRGQIALWLLIGFGLAYMIWGLKKGREHRHKHIDKKMLKKKTVAVWTLFAVFILGPCEPLIPLAFLGYNYGFFGILLVSLVFSLTTIIMMLAQTFLAALGVQWIKNDVAERYSHALAGMVIALTGVFVLNMGI